MKILVIGGSGFIGSHLVNRLARDGHQVSVLDLLERDERSGVHYYLGSHDDRELLERVVHGQDAVVQLVSTTVPATSNQDIEFDVQSNLISMIRLLEALVAQNVCRVLYLSSGGAVYGETQETPIPECHPLRPVSSYGVVKVAVENYLFMYQQVYGLRPIVIRPSNAYGPGQNLVKPQGVIGHFMAQTMRGESLKIWGDGSVRRDYLYIDDLVDLMVCSLESEEVGVFNAGAGVDVSLLEIVEVLESVVGRSLPREFLPARNCEVPRIRLDIKNARETFGWTPKISLLDGIQKQWDAIRARSTES